MATTSTIPLAVVLASSDVAAQALSALAKTDPSRYWYRRVAVAARDVRTAAAAVCRISSGRGEPPTCTAWVVAPGVLATYRSEPAVGSVVQFSSGAEARVRSVLRSDREPDIAFITVDGALPSGIPLARTAAPTQDAAVIGCNGERFLALARVSGRPNDPKLELGAALPPGASGAPVISLSLGEAIGLVTTAGAMVSAERIVAVAAVLGVGPLAAHVTSGELAGAESGLERRVDPSEYDDRKGYDPGFIGEAVPFPTPKGPLAGDVLEYDTTASAKSTTLTYTHFSVVMSRSLEHVHRRQYRRQDP